MKLFKTFTLIKEHDGGQAQWYQQQTQFIAAGVAK